MAKYLSLPAEVHDHFRKANLLHTYVQKDLEGAAKHALETGQELLAAKNAIPHGRWEDECDRLFDGKLRTAQFYMQFTRSMMALPKAQQTALLMLEGTLKGAAQAVKKAKTPESRQTGSGTEVGSETSGGSNGSQTATQEPRRGKGAVRASAAALVDKLIKQHIGHIARGLTTIAEANGGEGAQFKRANDGLNELIRGMQEMRKGKQ